MIRKVPVSPVVRALVLVLSLLCAVTWFAASSNPKFFYAAFGLSALVVITVPFLGLKEYDLFSPWSIVLLTVGAGCSAPAIATTFDWPDAHEIDVHSLLGNEPSFFYYPGFVLLGGFACVAIGYFKFPTKSLMKLSLGRSLSAKQLYLVMAGCVAVSFLAFAAYVVLAGDGSGRLSGKRTNIRTLDVQSDKGFSQYGYLRTFTELANIAFIVLFAYWSTRSQKLAHYKVFILGAIFLLACALPIYSSTRAQLIWLALASMGVMYYTNHRHLAVKFVLFGAAIFALFVMVTVLRDENADWQTELNNVGEHIVYSRNGPELAKTAHIINGLPDKLDYQYGKTIAVWLIAPIPREMLPGKPLISYGPVIGRAIYGNNVSGVPPGIVGELYLNFHIPGVIVGCLFFGWALRKSYEMIGNIEGDPAIPMAVYLFAFQPMAFMVLASSFGKGIICLVNLVIVGGVVYVSTITNANQSVSTSQAPSGHSRGIT